MTKNYQPTYDEAKDRLRVMLMALVSKLIAEAKICTPFEEKAVATA